MCLATSPSQRAGLALVPSHCMADLLEQTHVKAVWCMTCAPQRHTWKCRHLHRVEWKLYLLVQRVASSCSYLWLLSNFQLNYCTTLQPWTTSHSVVCCRHCFVGRTRFLRYCQQVQDLQAQSSAWALSAANYLTQLEDYQRHVTKLIGPRTKVCSMGFVQLPLCQDRFVDSCVDVIMMTVVCEPASLPAHGGCAGGCAGEGCSSYSWAKHTTC